MRNILQKQVGRSLTTKWLSWLRTSWRDSDHERFALVWKIRQPKKQPYNHNTLTTLRTSVKESLQMHFKVAVRDFHALDASR